jgi:hypothetical protein
MDKLASLIEPALQHEAVKMRVPSQELAAGLVGQNHSGPIRRDSIPRLRWRQSDGHLFMSKDHCPDQHDALAGQAISCNRCAQWRSRAPESPQSPGPGTSFPPLEAARDPPHPHPQWPTVDR